MSLIIRLKDVSFGNSALPTIGEYGRLYTDELLSLYKVDSETTYWDDSSVNQTAMVYEGDATGALAPSYADGVLSFPDPSGANENHHVKLGGTVEELSCTLVIAYKKLTTRTCYLFQSSPFNGVSFILGDELQTYSSATGSKKLTPNIEVGEWNIIVATIDETGVRVNRNGVKEGELVFAEAGGVPTVTPRSYYLGTESVGQGFQGDVAFVATYDRAMTDEEVLSTYKGVSNFLKNKKGIVV